MRRRTAAALGTSVAVGSIAGLFVASLPSTPRYAFDPEHVLELDVQIDPEDWEALRHQHRCPFADFASEDCATELFRTPYTWKTATVTIDGQTITRVGIRKKGWGTTYEMHRPGFNLRFNKYVKGQRWQGIRRLTLNTTRDPIRTCIAYEILAEAKVPAPRCAFANVRVNGRALGIYPVVETIDRQFLARHFDRKDGALFEGQLNDFRPDYRPRFEREDDGGTGQDPIDRLTEVLAREGEDVLAEIEKIVDVDAFLTFWAADVLIARWDGYAGHLNNFFLYLDPSTDRLRFIPWGGNRATFESLRDPVLSPPGRAMPETVIAHGILARRLYESEVGRSRYVERLRSLLANVWNEEKIIARIDRMEATLAGYPGEREPTDPIKRFVRARRRIIEDELNAGPPPWSFDPPESPCMVPAGTMSGSFSTIWTSSTAPDFERSGPAQVEITIDGETLDVRNVRAIAGPLVLGSIGAPLPHDAEGAPSIVIRADLPTQRLLVVLVAHREAFTSNNTIGFGDNRPGCEDAGPPFALICVESMTMCRHPAFVSRGALILDEADAREGATISGRFTAQLVKQPWGLFEGHPNIWRYGPPDRHWIRSEMRGYAD